MIQEPQTVQDIRDRLLEEYDVDAARCESDLFALLEKLAAANLVEIQNESAS